MPFLLGATSYIRLIMGPLQLQFDRIKEQYPDATLAPLQSGSSLISIPKIKIPPGWSASTASVRFIAPSGFPYAAPDCFWTDSTLRLVNGAMPQASNITPIPEWDSTPYLWFSWHIQSWNANRDTLMSYLGVILNRFRDLK